MENTHASQVYQRLLHARRTRVLSSITRLRTKLDQLEAELEELDKVIAAATAPTKTK